MSKQIEALKLAQDLRVLADRFSEGWHDGIKIDASDIVLLTDAAQALAEQPAQQEPKQPEQEPETVMAKYEFQTYAAYKDDGEMKIGVVPEHTAWVTAGKHTAPLEVAPVDAVNMSQERVDETVKNRNEPVVWMVQYKDRHEFVWGSKPEFRGGTVLAFQPLYMAPPKREWVGLTDEEMEDLWDRYAHMEMMRAIEAKLKEKNA